MPLKGRAKRNYNRMIRYGNWRQIYYNALGICEVCGEVADGLEIHEQSDGISVIEWHLVCEKCHLNIIHKDAGTEWIRRKYGSQLTQDVDVEVLEYGGLENWKQKYFIKDGLTNGNGIDIYKLPG